MMKKNMMMNMVVQICRGTGEIDGEECDNCGGTGVNPELEDN
jgi:DnaJ-class molecular chaperone